MKNRKTRITKKTLSLSKKTIYLHKKPHLLNKPKKSDLYLSQLEARFAADLERRRIPVVYERMKIEWTEPVKIHTYTPDFILPNGIIIEVKGELRQTDRKMHRFIKQQHPHLDIRFIFDNPRKTINPTSKTTYSGWCKRYKFKYAKGYVPQSWLEE